MSNLIFPSEVGQGTTGANKWGYRLPFKKTPVNRTIVQTPANFRGENRISLTPYPVWKYELDLAWMRGDFSTAQVSSVFQQIVGFYGKAQGRNLDWLFNDSNDNNVAIASGLFGIGDGSTTQFQLQRQIGGMRDIIQNLNGNPSIYDGGSLQTAFAGTGSAPLYYIGNENLLLQSQAFNSSPWVLANGGGASNPTVTANTVAAPDGTTTADTIAFPTCVGGYTRLQQAIPNGISAANETFTFSIWLKASSGTVSITLYIIDALGDGLTPVTATATTTWTRFSVTGTFAAVLPAYTNNVGLLFQSQNQGAVTVYAWGAQMERSAVASGYLPTTTAISQPQGVITFVTPPAAGHQLSWAGNFYNRCRFDDDEWGDLEEYVYQIWRMPSLRFRTVIL